MGFRLANIGGRAALVSGESYYDLEKISHGDFSQDPMEALKALSELSALDAQLEHFEPSGQLADIELGPPVPNPKNCYAVGLNYRNHAEESNMAIPPVPMVFTKHSSCISGPTADIEMRSDYVDFEGELVAVIGKTAKNVALEDALDCIAGLCIGQDISDRPAQFTSAPPQFNLGKSFDTYGPIGPALISMDEIDPDDPMMLTTEVNGEIRQHESTRDLIFDIPYLVAYLSQILTLHPGDLIFTGTPGGVGVVEGRFLKDGDIIRTAIEGLGMIENRCVRITDHSRATEIPDALKAAMANAQAK